MDEGGPQPPIPYTKVLGQLMSSASSRRSPAVSLGSRSKVVARPGPKSSKSCSICDASAAKLSNAQANLLNLFKTKVLSPGLISRDGNWDILCGKCVGALEQILDFQKDIDKLEERKNLVIQCLRATIQLRLKYQGSKSSTQAPAYLVDDEDDVTKKVKEELDEPWEEMQHFYNEDDDSAMDGDYGQMGMAITPTPQTPQKEQRPRRSIKRKFSALEVDKSMESDDEGENNSKSEDGNSDFDENSDDDNAEDVRSRKGVGARTRTRRKEKKGEYPCSQCGKVLRTSRIRGDHIRVVHEGVKNFRCGECPQVEGELPKEFFYRADCERHYKKFHIRAKFCAEDCRLNPPVSRGPKPVNENPRIVPKDPGVPEQFPCDRCDKSYFHHRSLVTHIRKMHEGDKRYECEPCGLGFFSEREHGRHLQKFHPEQVTKPPKKAATEEATVCEQCGNSYAHKYTLQAHIRDVHEGVRNYSCEYCPRQFFFKQKLNNHLITHRRGDDEEAVKGLYKDCKLCGKKVDRRSMNYHKLRFHGSQNVACSLCPRKFYTRGKLNDHIRNVHSTSAQEIEAKYARCSHEGCGKRVLKKGMAYHVRTQHLGIREKKYVCSTCDKAFENKSSLQRHSETHDMSDEQRKTCPKCDERFDKIFDKRLHVKSVHEGVKVLACSFGGCDRKFWRPRDLARHLNVHNKIFTHACRKCGKMLSSKKNLDWHEVFVCGVIEDEEERARIISKLKQDGKLYKCKKCAKVFGDRSKIKKHLKEAHSTGANLIPAAKLAVDGAEVEIEWEEISREEDEDDYEESEPEEDK